MAQLFANAARSTLTASITAASTQLQINPADQALFPVATGADWFKVALEDSSGNLEFMKVQRAVGQSLLTITERATEDATKFPARAFVAGSLVELRMTASDLASSIAHPSLASGAHAASAISVTPAGAIASTTVQAALQELDTEKAVASDVTLALNGKVGLTGTETIEGVKTFASSPMLPRNAAAALEAVPKQQLDAATRAGIASLSVAVASNAMTGTLAAETLDFRSATLTVGAPVPRTASASASLTVPSGATLGTVNGVQARIVWGWLDNAGTLEPFVANLAGGINLDETTLISTTAISASANSAGVAYSQTARTNVAFRVRGFCDITEATAGTWATAPTLVQGAGGQALTAMSSLGYGQTWQNFTASRAANVTYYNTTGRPICVSVNVTMGQTGQASFMVNGVSNIGYVSNVTPSTTVQLSTSCIVPAGGSYSLSSNSSFAFWVELR